MKKRKKICLVSSSGGHYEQILRLMSLSQNFDIYIVTEKTQYSKIEENIFYVQQLNRKEKFFFLKMIINFFQSLRIFLNEQPDIIISTGALVAIPTFLIGKCLGKKLIFIESFAKTNSPTMTGKLLYKISDKFIVQWESMLSVYPKAIYLGSIY